ncbi:hypothetical protein ACH42_07470 [Endozoicomonas sp. (ex Bugula neritina AB1)]|nr:hypothetical protein ACH42_07470 [Endozoicomonas sp. (ex Bugula neritina AB1)]
MSFIKKKPVLKQVKKDSLIFGCLLTSSDGVGFNGLRRANNDFLRGIIRYSRFREIHVFTHTHALSELRSEWAEYIGRYGSDKTIHFLSVHELASCFKTIRYQVFHQGDPYLGRLASLRDHCSPSLFPITGRAHTLSMDSHLLQTRDLLLSPLKSCDAILCSSQAQQQVMNRLLAAASSSINNHIGVAIPFKGVLSFLPLGVESSKRFSGTTDEAKQLLGYDPDCQVILTLGRISPSDKMDLHPLLLGLNELLEAHGLKHVLLVIAGSGDASDESIQSLLRQAYELNLEDRIRFELTVDEERKELLLAACDVFVSLSDNIQESFGIAPVEAMNHCKPVVLSDWNGYKELVKDEESGFLIPTHSADYDHLTRTLGVLLNGAAHLIQAQGTVVDVSRLVQVLKRLLSNDELRQTIANNGYKKAEADYSCSKVVMDYHRMVDDLYREAELLPHTPARPIGLPYRHVFGHYPTSYVNEKTRFLTTDRGVRVLLKSEQGHSYSELDVWLDEDFITELASECLNNKSLASLLSRYSERADLVFSLLWMSKYHLLQIDPVIEQASIIRTVLSLPEPQEFQNKTLPAELTDLLEYPETHRFKLMEPLLCWYIEQCEPLLPTSHSLLLKADVLNHVLNQFDDQLLQAIGWVAKEINETSYSVVLDSVVENGGIGYLADSFPHWYRVNCRMLLRSLRSCKLLFKRFGRDFQWINEMFEHDWASPAQSISRLSIPFDQGFTSVVIMTLDNNEKLVYKNRDLRIDRHLVGASETQDTIAGQLNQWLGDFPGIMTHIILCRQDRSHYGYCQYLPNDDHEVVLGAEQGADYYRHLGVLSAFSVLLGLGDLDHRNVITCAGKPWLIDGEVAFQPKVLRALERELSNPEAAFMRGISETAFEHTDLWRVWETFHVGQLRNSNVALENGELIPQSPHEWVPHFENVLRVGQRHSLDGHQPSLATEYSIQVVEGFRMAIGVVSENFDQWQSLLLKCRGYEVRYVPIMDLVITEKLCWDLKVFHGFQSFTQRRLKGYCKRFSTRIGLGGEEVQRWLEPEWKEPTALLAETVAEACLNGSPVQFTRVLGEGDAKVVSGGVVRIVDCEQGYFSLDPLDKAIRLSRILSEDSERRDQYVAGISSVILRWLEEQLVPGGSLPEELRQEI